MIQTYVNTKESLHDIKLKGKQMITLGKQSIYHIIIKKKLILPIIGSNSKEILQRILVKEEIILEDLTN